MEIDIIIILVSIVLSAFFSGMEIAFVSANKLHIELEKKRAGFIPNILSKLTHKSSKFITTMLVGNNISLVIYSYFMGKVIVNFLPINSFNEFSILFIQTCISTIIILVTAEFLPKAIFRVYANETLKIFTVPAYFFYLILYFFSSLINGISDFFLKLFFSTDKDQRQTEFSKEELGNYISEQLETGNGNDDEMDSEIQIFQNALEFSEVKSREVMIPRTELMTIEVHDTIQRLTDKFVESGYSKVLVFNNTVDDILGYVHSFDLFKKPTSIKSMLMPVEFVPETMLIKDVMNALIKKRRSIAVVLDEYGGTSGIMTIEDIVEELFGEIEDEHDSTNLIEEQLSSNMFKFSARLEVDYVNERYELCLPENENYETLGGMIVHYEEGIPEKNSQVLIEDYVIDVLEVSSTKIDLITVSKAEV